MNTINRIQPQGEVQHYQTYSIRAGSDAMVISACKDVGCKNWLYGWDVILDESTTEGKQLAIIARKSGRTFKEVKAPSGVTVFQFDSHQRCFEEHRTRPDIFTRRHGDWRGNPSGNVYRHTNARDWVEDFAENQQRLHDAQTKG